VPRRDVGGQVSTSACEVKGGPRLVSSQVHLGPDPSGPDPSPDRGPRQQRLQQGPLLQGTLGLADGIGNQPSQGIDPGIAGRVTDGMVQCPQVGVVGLFVLVQLAQDAGPKG
jgi:hypothetical protein